MQTTNTPSEQDDPKSPDTPSESTKETDSQDSQKTPEEKVETKESEKTISDLFEEPQKTEENPKEVEEEKKEVAQKKASDKIAENWAIKLANEEVQEEDVPDWIRERAVSIKEQTIAETKKEDVASPYIKKISELESSIKTLQESLTSNQTKEIREASELMMEKYLTEKDITPQQFYEDHWTTFIAAKQEMTSHNMREDRATEIALRTLGGSMKKEEAKDPHGLTPSGGTKVDSPQDTQISEKQSEIARKCGNDPKDVYK